MTAMAFLLPLFLLLQTCFSLSIFPPQNGSPAEGHLLFLCGDANLSEESYSPLMTQIQGETSSSPNLRLWGALSALPSPPAPSELASLVAQALSEISSRGTQIAEGQVFLAGHGQCAFLVDELVSQDPRYAGALLLQGYLRDPMSTGQRLRVFPRPVLTLGGELDGITRITRLAKEYRAYLQLLEEQDPDLMARTKPVAVVPGVNHAQLSNGRGDPSLAQYDLLPRVSTEEALRAVAHVAGAFLRANVAQEDQQALQILREATKDTLSLVEGFLQALEEQECTYCLYAQAERLNLSEENARRVSTTCNVFYDLGEFADNPPRLEVSQGNALIQVQNLNPLEPNPEDQTVIQVAPTQMNCKMKSQESVVDALNLTETRPFKSCRDINLHTMEEALNSVAPHAREHYLKQGRQLIFLPDVEKRIGPGWLISRIVFEPSSSTPNSHDVASISLYTALDAPGRDYWRGNHYCILFPPALAVEWILVDSLVKLGTN